MPDCLQRRLLMLAIYSACLNALICQSLFGTELTRYFKEVPQSNLVRRLHENPAELPNGLELIQEYRWHAQAPALVIVNQLVNRSDRAVHPGNISIADWTFSDDDAPTTRCIPLTYRDDIWYESTYWTGPDWTRVGKDWHHSGSHTSSIRRFLVPRDGQVTVSGRVYKADTNGGDGVRLEIRHGAQTQWRAEIDGDDQQGVTPNLHLQVRQGDTIRFIVHRRGTIGYDTTHWDPVITYADGNIFQASQSFSSHRQGEGGWYYEMESDADVALAGQQTSIHGFRNELLPFPIPFGASDAVALTPDDALPLWIIADKHDTSGIVLGIASSKPWTFHGSQSDSSNVRIQLTSTVDDSVLQPGESLELPQILLAPYDGDWSNGLVAFQNLVGTEPTSAEMASWSDSVRRAAVRVGIVESDAGTFQFDLTTLVQLDWQQQDQLDDSIDSYRDKMNQHLGRAELLLDDLICEQAVLLDGAATQELQRLKSRAGQAGLTLNDWRLLYAQTRWLKRRIALANPLLDFGPLLICKRVPTSYSHLVMQYYGWRARPGGGIFVVDRPGHSLVCRDILNGKLSHGNVLEPRLSYDGQRIVFSFVPCREDGSRWDPNEVNNLVDEGFYHIWTVNIDGSDLRQITHGAYDDLMPCWLPDGGIAFSSTRRRGYARCFGGQFSQRWHVYTLHRMNHDGTDLRLLSAHDTNEWFPTVSNSGHILYSRWDYIDRDAVTHQNLWAMRPDGTNPIAVWGNATNTPHCTFQPQPIPGSSKIVFTASAHHSITGGTIALLDPSISNNGHAALTRVTPEIPFPEAESRDIQQYYAAPWPLSDKYFLVAYSPQPLVWEPGANAHNALGIYLLDTLGNRELIYRDPRIGSTNPCPLVPRPSPPIVSSLLPANNVDQGEMLLANVYDGLGDVPAGSITQLRIIQIFPKTTPIADAPLVGLAREENARAILGTVPIQPDGSARFYVPALKPLLFQALDKDGLAYQTMRTVTYAQPGERISCYGCHDNRHATPRNPQVMALQYPPSSIVPGPLEGQPFSFTQVVQPILNQHCVMCHCPDKNEGDIDLTATPRDGFTQSYWSLCGDRDFWGPGTNLENASAALVPRFGGRNQIEVTPPGGQYGARGSRLIRLLRAGHYDVQLSPQELRQIAAWIDCNAIFYGSYRPEQQAQQLRGEPLAMPDIQ